MTLFTEGRLQAFERMMQDTGKYRRRDDDDRPKNGKKPSENKLPVRKGGGGHAGIQG